MGLQASEVVRIERRQLDEILELRDVLNFETAQDVRFEAECLRGSAAWWRTTMRPLLNEATGLLDAADILVQQMESVAARLERISLAATRPKGHA